MNHNYYCLHIYIYIYIYMCVCVCVCVFSLFSMKIPLRNNNMSNIQQKQENLPNYGMCRPGRPQRKVKRKRKERYVPGLCKGTEKNLWTIKVTVISSVNRVPVKSPKNWFKDWKTWKNDYEWRPSDRQHY